VFEHFGIEQEIERLLKRRVWLKSAATLIIDRPRRWSPIDVNSGKFTAARRGPFRHHRPDQPGGVRRSRRSSARDLGRHPVLDLIDMNAADRKRSRSVRGGAQAGQVALQDQHLSPLGLIEMTRKRTGETVNEQMDEPCPY
jgi:ribonuclease G